MEDYQDSQQAESEIKNMHAYPHVHPQPPRLVSLAAFLGERPFKMNCRGTLG